MSEQSVTLNLPEPLYQKLKERAALKQHSVETELLEVVAMAVPVTEELPENLTAIIDSLALQTDQSLWNMARSKVSRKDQTRFRALQAKQTEQGLSESEAAEKERILAEFDRIMLIRAHAAVLLKERGFDISELGPQK